MTGTRGIPGDKPPGSPLRPPDKPLGDGWNGVTEDAGNERANGWGAPPPDGHSGWLRVADVTGFPWKLPPPVQQKPPPAPPTAPPTSAQQEPPPTQPEAPPGSGILPKLLPFLGWVGLGRVILGEMQLRQDAAVQDAMKRFKPAFRARLAGSKAQTTNRSKRHFTVIRKPPRHHFSLR
jgi:hypothetical protein